MRVKSKGRIMVENLILILFVGFLLLHDAYQTRRQARMARDPKAGIIR